MKALLMILDGWGIGNKSKADVISVTPTPHWDALLAKYLHSQLQASGENVGLPEVANADTSPTMHPNAVSASR